MGIAKFIFNTFVSMLSSAIGGGISMYLGLEKRIADFLEITTQNYNSTIAITIFVIIFVIVFLILVLLQQTKTIKKLKQNEAKITSEETEYVPLPEAVEKIFNKKIKKDPHKVIDKRVIPYEIARDCPLYGIQEGASVIEFIKNDKDIPFRIDEYNSTRVFRNGHAIDFIKLFVRKKDLKSFIKEHLNPVTD